MLHKIVVSSFNFSQDQKIKSSSLFILDYCNSIKFSMCLHHPHLHTYLVHAEACLSKDFLNLKLNWIVFIDVYKLRMCVCDCQYQCRFILPKRTIYYFIMLCVLAYFFEILFKKYNPSFAWGLWRLIGSIVGKVI